jgi:D-tyrosyl-tRNA(Tyr) deacylase
MLKVKGKTISETGFGLVCYLGVARGDTQKDLIWLARKVSGLRIFPDSDGKMNLSALDVGGEILCVSQFTLFGDIRNGYRPGFSAAEEPETARKMYEKFCKQLEENGISKVGNGIFGADMLIEQQNQGPVTIMIDSREKKNR